MKKFKESVALQEIEKISGVKLILDKKLKIDSVCSLEEAEESSAAFYQDEKYEDEFLKSNAGVIFIPEQEDVSQLPVRNYLLSQKPYESFLRLVEYFIQNEEEVKIGKQVHCFSSNSCFS